MSAQGTYRFYSVQRQTILLVNGEPLGRERVKINLRKVIRTLINQRTSLPDKEKKELQKFRRLQLINEDKKNSTTLKIIVQKSRQYYFAVYKLRAVSF